MRLPRGSAAVIHPVLQCGILRLYQRAKMLTHHALELLKRRTGLTKAR
jgi:hypothetical protein